MRYLRGFNEDKIDSDYLTNVLIDLVDDGFIVDGPNTGSFFNNEDRRYFQISRVNSGTFSISDIYDSLVKLERYSGISFIYLFEDLSHNEYDYDSIDDAYRYYDGYMSTIYVVFNK